MSDIAEQILAAIDKIERAAAAVPSHLASPWTGSERDGYCGDDYRVVSSTGQDVVGPGYEGGGVWGVEPRDHIALNDPAVVLRRCAADREIIQWYQVVTNAGVHAGVVNALNKVIKCLARGYGVTP